MTEPIGPVLNDEKEDPEIMYDRKERGLHEPPRTDAETCSYNVDKHKDQQQFDDTLEGLETHHKLLFVVAIIFARDSPLMLQTLNGCIDEKSAS